MPGETAGKTETLALSAPEKLSPRHDFSHFDCGEESINRFATQAHKQAKFRNSVVYVVCEAGTDTVRGFYTLSNGSVIRNEAPRNMQRFSTNEIPVTLLGRLGVDQCCQGRGLGLDLLQDALERAIAAAGVVGSRAVLVHALDERMAEFYKKHAGFKESTVSPLTLFLAL
jgi:GNAT superfamily N-acetyltransferase